MIHKNVWSKDYCKVKKKISFGSLLLEIGYSKILALE